MIGSSDADCGQFPSVVQICDSDCDEEPTVKPRYTGTILNPSWILTAAHCVYQETGNHVRPKQIMLGESASSCLDLRTKDTRVYVPGGPGIRYDAAGRGFKNDVALIHVLKGLPVSTRVLPTLVGPGEEDMLSCWPSAIAAGWGKVEDGTYPKALKYAGLCVRRAKEVPFEWTTDSTLVHERVVLAGDTKVGGRSGDSGGPLFVQNSSGKRTLVGVFSMGALCGPNPLDTGIYTRLASTGINAWIRQTAGL